MKLLLQKVSILSPGSQHHMKVKDVLINDSIIEKIAEPNTIVNKDSVVIKADHLYVSSGWMDLHVNFRTPGHEYKEGLKNGCAAAANGGFTTVLLMPSTLPTISNRSSVELIINTTKSNAVNVYPAGSMTVDMNGNDMSEMYDMYLAGAKAFTDDKKSVSNAGLLIRSLQYSQQFGGKIFLFAEDESISGKHQINDGPISVSIGIKGQPNIAEEVMIIRDLTVGEFCHCPIHFSTISTAGSVSLIRTAKAKGIKVTCDVSVMHLFFNDTTLESFDTTFKIRPPLRSEADRIALLEGLKDGTIDCITSDHQPEDSENKLKEFELAAYGASTIDTTFSAARKATEKYLSLPELVSKFTTHPRCIVGLKNHLIEEGQIADLTIFDAEEKWNVKATDIISKSKYNPFIDHDLLGRVIGIYNTAQLVKSKRD